MKKIYIYFVIAFTLAACSSKNKVPLFNGLYYNLSKNERVLKTSGMVKIEYENLVDTEKVNIPLFKCIDAIQYKIFIGLPYEMSLADLKTSFLKETTLLEEDIKEGTSIFKKYKKEGTFISKYIFKKQQGLIAVFCVSTKENALTKQELKNKITENDEE